jgi:hypothetical protein
VLLSVVRITVLMSARWAFGREKLLSNPQVKQAAQVAAHPEQQPVYSGKVIGRIHQTNGQAAIHKEVVELAQVERGAPKRNESERSWDLPSRVDLNQYQALYGERIHAIFGVSRLKKCGSHS